MSFDSQQTLASLISLRCKNDGIACRGETSPKTNDALQRQLIQYITKLCV
jgi:hypothetical protein